MWSLFYFLYFAKHTVPIMTVNVPYRKEIFMSLSANTKEIARLYVQLNETEPHTAEYKTILERLETLQKMHTDELAIVVDEQKNKRDNKTKIAVEVGVFAISTGVLKWFADKGFRFEEHGTFASTTTRWLINKLKLKYK